MYRYLGGGFLPGVPMRDISDEEADKYGPRKLSQSGLYRRVKDKEQKQPVVETEQKEGE